MFPCELLRHGSGDRGRIKGLFSRRFVDLLELEVVRADTSSSLVLYALGNRGALVRRWLGDWGAHGLLFKLGTASFGNSFLHFNAVIKIVLNYGVEASKINHFLLLGVGSRCCKRGVGRRRIPTSLEVRPLALKFVKLL